MAYQNSRFLKAVKLIFINLVVFCGLAAFLLSGLEIVLRTTNWLDQVNSPTPFYIPPKFKRADQAIDGSGLKDIWGFRSKDGADQVERLRNSNKAKCRVAILGDSQIQGDGLRIGGRWPDQYQQLTKCDVFAFGRNGWTTVEMFAFYEGRLRHLDFDWLVISFVLNDPHPRLDLSRTYLNLSRSRFERYTLPKHNYIRLRLGLLGVSADYACGKETGFCWWVTRTSSPLKMFRFLLVRSRALDYLDQMIGTFSRYFSGSTTRDKNGNLVVTEWGYTNWRNRLYRQDVFSMWEGAIADFRKFSRHPFIFLLTNYNDDAKLKTQVAESLKKADISYFDCATFNENLYVSGFRPRQFWANLADGHPGTKEAHGFAQCLYWNLDLKHIRFTPVYPDMVGSPPLPARSATPELF